MMRYGMVGVNRYLVTRRRVVGAGRIRRPAVVSVFGEDCWPPVRCPFGLDG